MLLSIVNPSAEIREGYQYYLVQTTDDRVLSGFFVDRDRRTHDWSALSSHVASIAV